MTASPVCVLFRSKYSEFIHIFQHDSRMYPLSVTHQHRPTLSCYSSFEKWIYYLIFSPVNFIVSFLFQWTFLHWMVWYKYFLCSSISKAGLRNLLRVIRSLKISEIICMNSLLLVLPPSIACTAQISMTSRAILGTVLFYYYWCFSAQNFSFFIILFFLKWSYHSWLLCWRSTHLFIRSLIAFFSSPFNYVFCGILTITAAFYHHVSLLME